MSIDRMDGSQPPQFNLNGDPASPEAVANMLCLGQALLETRTPVIDRQIAVVIEDGPIVSFQTETYGDRPDDPQSLTLTLSNHDDGDLLAILILPDGEIAYPHIINDDFSKIVAASGEILDYLDEDEDFLVGFIRDIHGLGVELTTGESTTDENMFLRWLVLADEVKKRVDEDSGGGLRCHEYSASLDERYEVYVVSNSGVDGIELSDLEACDMPRFCIQIDDLVNRVVYCYQIEIGGDEKLITRQVSDSDETDETSDHDSDEEDTEFVDDLIESMLNDAGMYAPGELNVEFIAERLTDALAKEIAEQNAGY